MVLHDASKNIEAGIKLIKGIQSRLSDPTIAKIATLYNDIGESSVSRYGKTVGAYHHSKPWKHFSRRR